MIQKEKLLEGTFLGIFGWFSMFFRRKVLDPEILFAVGYSFEKI